ncbi:MAG: YjgP/YjgQ family permease [Ignavibacteria bacterium]|nr:YjgP/YjgQ family permease [Ignavibacteria bacterium]
MIIYRYIFRNLLFPFLGAIFVLTAVLLLQFLMKFADNLVGKGLSIFVIIKLVVYNLAWMFVLVVPMAVLVATIMAFGTMGQNNEIAILKASGVSLYKLMIPPVAFAVLLCYSLIQFNNHVYPDANHAARLLMVDISKQKPTLSLIPGVFSQEVENYSILARGINPETNDLTNLTIYDYSSIEKVNIITARKGKIYFAKEHDKIIMDLEKGQIHEAETRDKSVYRILKFDKHKIVMNGDKFSFKQTGPGEPRSNRELGAAELVVIADSLNREVIPMKENFSNLINNYFFADSLMFNNSRATYSKMERFLFFRAEDMLKSARNSLRVSLADISFRQKNINNFWVEIHKKYSIPFACIVFVLVGAPLGAIARKGGMGVAAPLSLIFIFIYWAFLIGGEKLADRGLLSPLWGMWSANVVLGVLGVFMTIQSARERITLDFSRFQRLVPKSIKKLFGGNEDN